MKLLHIITGLETGGAEASLYKLVRHSSEHRIEHTVCSLKGHGPFGPKIVELGVPVHELDGTVLGIVRGVRGLVARLQPTVVQGWMYHGNLAASLGRSAGRVPILWNIRQTLSRKEKPGTALAIRLGAALSHHPNCIIYNSMVAAIEHEALGYVKAKTRIIPNGFDTELFKPDCDAKLKIRSELGFAADVPLIGCVARVHPMKDHGNFLHAAKKVGTLKPEAVFVLVGRNTDSPQLAKTICELGLQNNVRALGERSDIPAIMAALDILVVSSSWSEAFPNVVGEAMACGVPCVVTNVGDSSHIVGDTGLAVPSQDADALADGMLSLLQGADLKALGTCARERIMRHYSIATMTEQYVGLYCELMDR